MGDERNGGPPSSRGTEWIKSEVGFSYGINSDCRAWCAKNAKATELTRKCVSVLELAPLFLVASEVPSQIL